MDPVWHDAIVRGDLAAVRALLDHDAAIDSRDRHGQTALMLAAHRGHEAVVEALIDAGAALDVTAKYGLSALMLAVVAGHDECARRLAAAGADRTIRGVGAPGFAGKTAADLAAARGCTELATSLAPEGSS